MVWRNFTILWRFFTEVILKQHLVDNIFIKSKWVIDDCSQGHKLLCLFCSRSCVTTKKCPPPKHASWMLLIQHQIRHINRKKKRAIVKVVLLLSKDRFALNLMLQWNLKTIFFLFYNWVLMIPKTQQRKPKLEGPIKIVGY